GNGRPFARSAWDTVGPGLEDVLLDCILDRIRHSVGSIADSIENSIWYSLFDTLRDSLWDSIRVNLDGFSWGTLSEQWYGQTDSYWISFNLFCRDVIGMKYESQESGDLDLWRDIARSACWWWPYKNFCVIS